MDYTIFFGVDFTCHTQLLNIQGRSAADCLPSLIPNFSQKLFSPFRPSANLWIFQFTWCHPNKKRSIYQLALQAQKQSNSYVPTNDDSLLLIWRVQSCKLDLTISFFFKSKKKTQANERQNATEMSSFTCFYRLKLI